MKNWCHVLYMCILWNLVKSTFPMNRICSDIQVQESPPAWTQEAYRPLRIKYYWGGVPPPPIGVPPARPDWGGGLPEVGYPQSGPMGGTQGGVPPHQGTPPARSDRGWGYLRWGTPHRGTPWPGLMGVPEVGYPHQGTPPARSNGGRGSQGGVPPSQVWWGYSPAGPGWGTPPPT